MKRVSCRALLLLLVSCAGSSHSQTPKQKLAEGIPDCAPFDGQVLRCPKLGFTYQAPFGWVDRTREMQQGGGPAPQSNSLASKTEGQQPAEPTGKILLSIFERPPGTGDTLDPAVVIAVEDRSAYPEIKSAADYISAIAEVAQQRGLKMRGDPYPFAGGSDKVVRADFTQGSDGVRQSTIACLYKNYILSFTFLAANEEDVDRLVENLSVLTNPRKPSPGKK